MKRSYFIDVCHRDGFKNIVFQTALIISEVIRMTVTECQKCKFHENFDNGAVYCDYDRNIVCFASVYDHNSDEYVILSCPKEKNILPVKES
jgi:hypothetical protein